MVNPTRLDIFNAHRQPALTGGHIGDPPAHQAAAQHRNARQRSGLCFGATVFFQIGTGKEDRTQRLRLRGHRQFAKRASFFGVTAAATVGQAILDNLQNSLHRRIVPLGLALRLFADEME